MRIALINENSQASKNGLIETVLRKVVEPMGHTVDNYGMYSAEDEAQLTYVQCGLLASLLLDPSDGYMFAQINDGNCVALPFAKDFGWGAELKLEMIFQQLFGFGHGNGYPKERVVPEQRNKKILDGVKALAYRPLIDILRDLDPDFVRASIAGKKFSDLFYPNCKDQEIADFLKSIG